MIVAVDLEQLAELARLEAQRHPARTPAALAGFAAPDVQAAALELLHRLAAGRTRA